MYKVRVVSEKEYKRELKGEAIAALISLGFLAYAVFRIIPELF